MGLSPSPSQVQEEDLTRYQVDGLIPHVVTLPNSMDDLGSILRAANNENLSVVARGSGTKIGMGNITKRLDIVVSSLRLNRVIEYNPSDLNVTAECGVRLVELQRELAKKDQFIPFDPPFSTIATLGGIVATNSTGPRRLRYGSIRDNLIGIRVVHADGKITKSGGRVVKNVAGYDLKKLYIGSLGTLAYIGQLTLRTFPLPEKESTVIASYSSLKGATESGLSILRSVLLPTGLEILDDRFVDALGQRIRTLQGTSGPLLIARFEGVSQDVDRQVREAEALFKRFGASFLKTVEGRVQEELWVGIMDFSKVLSSNVYGVVVLKAGYLISKTGEIIEKAHSLGEERGIRLFCHSHLGLGISRIYGAQDETEKWVKVISELREYLGGSSGYAVVEEANPQLRKTVDAWGTPMNEFKLMKAIKAKFDPKSILSPGRFVGGI